MPAQVFEVAAAPVHCPTPSMASELMAASPPKNHPKPGRAPSPEDPQPATSPQPRIAVAVVAATLGINQVAISKMESQTNLYVSTLRRVVEAMGGERRIVVRFPQGAIEINPFQRKPEPVKPDPTELAAA